MYERMRTNKKAGKIENVLLSELCMGEKGKTAVM